jgi:hypothetical protein
VRRNGGGVSLPVVAHLRVRDTERAPLVAAVRRSMSRGQVEYDPTRMVLVHAGLAAGGDVVPLTVPSLHALLDVLRWTNSTEQRTRWPKDALDALKALRTRAEHGGDDIMDGAEAEPEPTPEWMLW